MGPMRLLSFAAAAVLTTATLATAACGQTRDAEAGGGEARSSVSPDSVRARADRSRAKGPDTARVTIIEVSDFQCPYCAQFARETYPRLDSAYVQPGKVRMIYIHLPLVSHAEAFRASEASMCAGAQGRFWEMHDRLFAAQREWSGEPDAVRRFEGYAEELGLEMPEYRDCMLNGRTAALVVSDAMEAASAGVSGTPSFLINSAAGQRVLGGAVPFDQLARELDALLAGQPLQPDTTAPAQPQ